MTTLTARWATAKEQSHWDELVTENPNGGDFLQTTTLAEAKRPFGMEPRYVIFEERGERVSVAMFHERRVPVFGKLWWGCRVPAVASVAELERHVDALRRFIRASARGVFTVTFEPPVVGSEDVEAQIATSSSLSAPDLVRRDGIQANTHTAIVQIDKSDDELLASFSKKSRNMVRRAARDGVEVREYPADRATFDRMHELMRLVGGGKDGLLLRPKEYVEALWRGFAERGQGRFFGVEADGQIAVLAFVITVGEHGTYKDGGSERPLVSPGMSNLLHFEIMKIFRDEGVRTYDMFGVAPPEAQGNDDPASYALGNFKLSFTDRTSHIGAFDLVVRKQQHRLWTAIGERAYAKLYRTRTGDFSIY